ncbi:bifunctional 2-polyprenyl-6-hydroxyphenol methylase/3-demethylubiquinol 3-O-methyltransferase UbiG [Streptomyces sp. TRM64462]|uniref:class I SAM-dependent methyltransferase n=1 Tax=Streptomyces sp. TRM64462 TaxID=2741726 RepID=UPI001586501A|nr:class I SAM-dependent methyltransferase [Streptomyces sp. TRM64462]
MEAQTGGLDMAATQAFAGRFLADMGGGMVSIMCALGDELGLFRALAGQGPAGSADLASRTGLDERYVREWLLCLSSAGYVTVDPADPADPGAADRFSLPAEHAAVLAFEESPFFMGGAARLVPALATMTDALAEAFRGGHGVPQERYPAALYRTMWQMSSSWLNTLLLPQWVPAIDGLAKRLESGAPVAHVGSGGGRALVLLAQAFPGCRCTGYDRLRLNVERARREAAEAGVADRVEIVEGDAERLLPATGDHALVMCFDVLHDAPDPAAALRAVRGALAPDGVFLLLESNGADRPADNSGPAAAMLYGASVLYSVPASRAAGGAALGLMGLPPERVRALCAEAGLRSVKQLPSPTPLNALYEIRP